MARDEQLNFMGISVSAGKAVSLNDTHEEGVDTSTEGNPTQRVFKGINMHHIFSRSGKTGRQDDGNPLIHALKGRDGFAITPFWKGHFMSRAGKIVDNMSIEPEGFDYCLPIPSSSSFCGEIAGLVSGKLGIPLLAPNFFRKKTTSEMLQGLRAFPPRIRPGARSAYTTQLNSWQSLPADTICEAKRVDTTIRLYFDFFIAQGTQPNLQNKNIVIVDDIFSSGSSVLSVRNIVQNQLGAEVSYISFLSGLR